MTVENPATVPAYKLRRSSTSELNLLIEYLQSEKGSAVDFVQIGGNDGILADPIQVHVKNNLWRGTILEPVPHYFRQLEKNYQGFPRVELLNMAAGPRGKATIYYAKEQATAKANRFLGQGVASFNRTHVQKFGFDDDEILDVEVPVVPLSGVFAGRSRGTDLLVIDVEGSELEVLESMDWCWPVRVIMFESDNLSCRDRHRVQTMLEAAGMGVFWRWPDSFAVTLSETGLLSCMIERERTLDELMMHDLSLLAGKNEIFMTANSAAVSLLGDGWSLPEEGFTWSCAEEAALTIPASMNNRFIRSAVFHYVALAPLDDLIIEFRVAGSLVVREVVGQSNQLIQVATEVLFPVKRHGGVDLELRFTKPVRPASLGLSSDQRDLAIAISRIELKI